jgi:hypothetical protein
MTIEAVDALRADHASLAALARKLTPSEWSAPSAWRDGACATSSPT